MLNKFFKLPWSKKSSSKDQTTTISKKTDAAAATSKTATAKSTASAKIETRTLIDLPIDIAQLKNTDTLLETLLKHTPAQRQTALESLDDEEPLRQLSKQAEKLDKRSNQIVREHLKAFREKQQNQKECEEKLEKLCLRLESLSRTQHNALFDSELFHLEQTWQHSVKDIKQGFNTLIERGKTALSNCQTIKRDAENVLEAARIASELEAAKQAETESAKTVEEISANPVAEEQPSAFLEEIQAAQKAITAEKQKLREEKQQQVAEQLENNLPKLEKAIEDRDLKKSRELATQLQNMIRQLEPKRANAFSGKLQLLQNQLRDLQDWQEYATLPKLEALCASMEQLVTTSLPAPQKASAIRELQDQWRSMKLPASTTAQELWITFKKFSDEAYAPCADYFAREKENRAFNLAQRIQICESLEQYYQQTNSDSVSINWKAMSQIITTAKQEFQKFHPVERSDEKSIRERFESAIKPLSEKLYGEYQRNEAQKQQLIDEVNTLLNSDDLPKAIDRTRAIQQQWKTINPCRRAQDQKLWEAFQLSCNSIFEKRQQNQQQAQQEQAATIAQAESLCEQIISLAKLDDSELTQSSAQFKSLQEQFNTLSDVGEKNRLRLQRKFNDACDTYRQQIAGINQREQQRQLDKLSTMAALCQQLEYKPDAATIDQLVSEWEAIDLNSKYQALLQPRYQNALAIARGEASVDYAANEEQLRQLCIELEFLTGSDTPEEDRQRRRDYQMQALTKNFGKGAINHHQQIEKSTMDWYTIGAATAATQTVLQARFDALRTNSSLQ